MSTVRKRLAQGIRSLRAPDADTRFPGRYRSLVSDDVVARWEQLPPYDRQHLLAVTAELERQEQSADVVLAGLLHDIGKPPDSPTISRVMHVFLHRLGATHIRWVHDKTIRFPGMRTLRALIGHPQYGAEFLATQGTPDRVVWLVRHHHETIADSGLRAIQDADDKN